VWAIVITFPAIMDMIASNGGCPLRSLA